MCLLDRLLTRERRGIHAFHARQDQKAETSPSLPFSLSLHRFPLFLLRMGILSAAGRLHSVSQLRIRGFPLRSLETRRVTRHAFRETACRAVRSVRLVTVLGLPSPDPSDPGRTPYCVLRFVLYGFSPQIRFRMAVPRSVPASPARSGGILLDFSSNQNYPSRFLFRSGALLL